MRYWVIVMPRASILEPLVTSWEGGKVCEHTYTHLRQDVLCDTHIDTAEAGLDVDGVLCRPEFMYQHFIYQGISLMIILLEMNALPVKAPWF